jgi:hypothetical protein
MEDTLQIMDKTRHDFPLYQLYLSQREDDDGRGRRNGEGFIHTFAATQRSPVGIEANSIRRNLPDHSCQTGVSPLSDGRKPVGVIGL